MVDEQKLNELLELKRQRDDIDTKINALLGGETPKRKWTRRAPEEAKTMQEGGGL